jgi:hypothetical protein
MIYIEQSKTADMVTPDPTQVTKETLLASTQQHVNDVNAGIRFLTDMMIESAKRHDFDKFENIDDYHTEFLSGFNETNWWNNHKSVSRHHLFSKGGIPDDVNLIDVMEMITDCVMAGMSRTGYVYTLKISPDVLMKAFDNTIELLKSQVVVY